eukprot:sb/3471747/
MATPALAAKERGNAAYKAKKFTEAIAAYDEAISLDSTDVTFYNNKGAVHFEKGEYDQVIDVCTKGLDVGREQRADYKHVAKSLSRIGKAYFKKGDLDSAMTFYDKAICEHRDPAILKERSEIGKVLSDPNLLGYSCSGEMVLPGKSWCREMLGSNTVIFPISGEERLDHARAKVARHP